ncbi:hypothetical protein LZ30DRAFT_735681 [Colletotrichum cereale]|nr:hypothetical protein LZ30DRAFT_735681 [Colletotrichum cereale]
MFAMKFTTALLFIAQMAGGALALGGDNAKCQLNIECLSGYCKPRTGSTEYVCWGSRRKGDYCNVNFSGQVCNKGLACKSTEGSSFLGRCS